MKNKTKSKKIKCWKNTYENAARNLFAVFGARNTVWQMITKNASEITNKRQNIVQILREWMNRSDIRADNVKKGEQKENITWFEWFIVSNEIIYRLR